MQTNFTTPLSNYRKMKELWLRFWEPQNTFWNRVIIVLLMVSGVCIIIGDFSQDLLDLGVFIPEKIANWARYGRVAGPIGMLIAKFTVRDTEKIKAAKYGQ